MANYCYASVALVSAGMLSPLQLMAQQIINPEGGAYDHWGINTAIDGDTAVIGGRGVQTYIYDLASVQQLFKLDPGSYSDVAIDGDYTVLGNNRMGGTNSGEAYVYQTSTGNLLHTIVNPEASNQDQFGYSVSVSGEKIVIGALFGDAQAAGGGSVYVYNASSGLLERRLDSPSPMNYDKFGHTVVINDDIAAVSAIGDGTTADNAGSVFVYNVSSGALMYTIANPNPSVYDQFGYSLAINDNYIVASTQPEIFDEGYSMSGNVYVFSKADGTLLRTLNNPDTEVNDYYGMSVSVNETKVLVGAGGKDSTDGSAYLFDLSSGMLLNTINNPTAGYNEGFGYEVAMSETSFLVSAPDERTGASQSGAVYSYNMDGSSFRNSASVPEISERGALAAIALIFALLSLMSDFLRSLRKLENYA